eukprot:4867089-Amphidinium_carterae.1
MPFVGCFGFSHSQRPVLCQGAPGPQPFEWFLLDHTRSLITKFMPMERSVANDLTVSTISPSWLKTVEFHGEHNVIPFVIPNDERLGVIR